MCELFPEDDLPAADDPVWWDLDEPEVLGWHDPRYDAERDALERLRKEPNSNG